MPLSTPALEVRRHAIDPDSEQSHRIRVERPRIRGGERGQRVEPRVPAGHESDGRRILRHARPFSAGEPGAVKAAGAEAPARSSLTLVETSISKAPGLTSR